MKKILLMLSMILLFGCHNTPASKTADVKCWASPGKYLIVETNYAISGYYAMSYDLDKKACNIENFIDVRGKRLKVARECGDIMYDKMSYGEKGNLFYSEQVIKRDKILLFGVEYDQTNDCYLPIWGIANRLPNYIKLKDAVEHTREFFNQEMK